MTVERISLYDRLTCLKGTGAAHPEYDGAVIQSMARMPIARYLGDYDTFCDFQLVTEVREDLPYQTVAKVIADQTWTPEDMAQILGMLAAPVVQIEEAYRQGKSTLLPYRKQTRIIHQRVESLTSRLEGAGALAGPPYNLHRMFIQTFFSGVSGLTGDLHFPSMYRASIRPHLPDENMLFRGAVYSINSLKSPERTDLLYKVLVEPFAALPGETK